MADPHNKARYGELWPQEKIDTCLQELGLIKPYIILSGGWAWHFMSPVGHKELKHAHDHKDIDIFVEPQHVSLVISILTGHGFDKARTIHDNKKNNDDFRRYEKVVSNTLLQPFRVTIDFFVKNVQSVEINGWKVVDPKHLITLYSTIHSSGSCFAVKAASKLLARGISPIGREELVQIPKE